MAAFIDMVYLPHPHLDIYSTTCIVYMYIYIGLLDKLVSEKVVHTLFTLFRVHVDSTIDIRAQLAWQTLCIVQFEVNVRYSYQVMTYP